MSQQAIPVLNLPVLLTGAVVAQRFVTNAGAQTAANGYALGVCRTAGASGERVGVDVLGTAIVEAGAAIAAGASLGSDASGRAVTFASGGKLGVALQAASAAGDKIEILLLPNAA